MYGALEIRVLVVAKAHGSIPFLPHYQVHNKLHHIPSLLELQ